MVFPPISWSSYAQRHPVNPIQRLTFCFGGQDLGACLDRGERSKKQQREMMAKDKNIFSIKKQKNIKNTHTQYTIYLSISFFFRITHNHFECGEGSLWCVCVHSNLFFGAIFFCFLQMIFPSLLQAIGGHYGNYGLQRCTVREQSDPTLFLRSCLYPANHPKTSFRTCRRTCYHSQISWPPTKRHVSCFFSFLQSTTW